MPRPTSRYAAAFRRLRRALPARRLWRLEPARRGAAATRPAIVFARHVAETVERLCDRFVVLHLGRVVCALDRAAWGGPEPGPSPLERQLLSAIPSPPAREGSS